MTAIYHNIPPSFIGKYRNICSNHVSLYTTKNICMYYIELVMPSTGPMVRPRWSVLVPLSVDFGHNFPGDPRAELDTLGLCIAAGCHWALQLLGLSQA